MKNTIKVLGIIVLVAIIGFSMMACDDGSTTDGGGGTGGTEETSGSSNTSLDGVWVCAGNDAADTYGTHTITINGDNAIINDFISSSAGVTDAVNKGYFGNGKVLYKNLQSAGNLKWSGQQLVITGSGSNATGSMYRNVTLTMSADGQTLNVIGTDNTGVSIYRRGHSLDGVWVCAGNDVGSYGSHTVTISGSSGTMSSYTPSGVWLQDAVDRGFYGDGKVLYRNIVSAGNLTWSGEQLVVYRTSTSSNVATGSGYRNITITMSANGQNLTVTGTDGTGVSTYTRQ